MSGHGRSLAEPQFPDDDGQPDPRLVGADEAGILQALPDARIFVPIVPVLGERATDGSDKSADMAAVLMTGADGRTALLAFTSTASLESWNPSARPVPVLGADAARACLDEGASAILLDLPAFRLIETTDVEHLAAGHRLIDTPDGPAWVQ